MSTGYLVVLGEGEAIAWVLREQRMAFPATPRAEVAALAAGDRLFLYATRGAWHNPTRDEGRVIAAATVRTAVRKLDRPVAIAGRDFFSDCELRVDGLVAYPGGVPLKPLVHRLDAFPKPQAWSVYLRRPLVRLSTADAGLLDAELKPLLATRTAALTSYPSRG